MSLFSETDVAGFRTDRISLVQQDYLSGLTLSDSFLLEKLQIAEQETSQALKVLLEPTKIFPFPPQQSDIDALQGAPYAVEGSAYDYDPEFFQANRWGFISTRQTPIVSVDFVRFAYPTPQQTFYTFPSAWLRIDNKFGTIQIVPYSAAFSAPLDAFAMQVLSGGGTLPSMLQVQYTAALTNATTAWPAVIDVIKKKAVLSLLQDKLQAQSGSISADGLSQSLSIDIGKMQDEIDRKLFGPKGSNGGLWTAIHGVSNGVLGVLA